jgi:FkbH-like protein
MLERISTGIRRMALHMQTVVALPALPLPPLFHTPGWQAAEAELLLHRDLMSFASELAHEANIAIVNPQFLAEVPLALRLDIKSDMLTGFPYAVAYVDHLTSALAKTLIPPAPKKGIISDLDDTLWSGVVGEIGAEQIGWDLASRHQLHGLYQQLLSSLAEAGVLIGIASKNDPQVVRQAFERSDLRVHRDQIYPIEAHWNAKSVSVARILANWNISADSVIFIDDSSMELSEVAKAHPGIECIQFPKDNYVAGLAMLRRLRDLCGKQQVSPEDKLRLDSIRSGEAFRQQSANASTPEDFLRQANGAISLDFHAAKVPRILELVNKTNQFNLNGRRYTESDWQKQISHPDAFVAAVAYEDKFGSLGTIAVIQGRLAAELLYIDTWVLSCRAFSRRIEYACLEFLFECTNATEIEFDFASTPKNGPIQDFFVALIGRSPHFKLRVTRDEFSSNCPEVYSSISKVRRAETHA